MAKKKTTKATSSPAKTPKAGTKRLNRKDKSPLLESGQSRLKYIADWKAKRDEERAKAERRLNSYVDRLVKKYPDQYLEKIKEGLESEEKFRETMEELEVDSEDLETEREFLEKFSRTIKIGD